MSDKKTGPQISRRERKKRSRKQAIYDVAVACFIEHGYDDSTIDQIADGADIARATFFNYYPSKLAILHEIAAEALDYARRTFNLEFSDESAPIRDKLRRSVGRFASIVERNPSYYQTVFLDAMSSQTGSVKTNQDIAKNLISELTEHLHKAQLQGELDGSLDPAQLAEMFTGIYMYAILNYILQGCPGSLVERISKAADIFLDGCKARDQK
jgi:AcrR family transcriptional regulator